MPSVQRAREVLSTLRFQLVLLVTLVVFVMVVVTNLGVRVIEQQALRQEYDQFLLGSVNEVEKILEREKDLDEAAVVAELRSMVLANENRAWFVQLGAENGQIVFSSENAPAALSAPFQADSARGPYNAATHRVVEKKITLSRDVAYHVRCGFLQIALQEDIDLINRNILVVSLSILLAAPIGAYVIALRATRPISQIIATAAHLQPTNLNERLPIRGTGDEIDQLSVTINGMLDRLASYIDRNRDFVANAAHELRSPLAAIRSSVEVALNRSRSAEEYTAILADVIEECSRLAGLINRLLVLAEGDAGRLAAKDQTARLDQIVQESVDMFGAVAELKGMSLRSGPLPIAMVNGDETYLRQVVRNLIDNAIKYNREGGEVRIALSIDADAKHSVLVVQDTGIGIDPALVPRVFERFFRGDRSRSRVTEKAGYGLGLSICQSIIQALNGAITVESEPDRGTRVTVRLPLAESVAPPT